MEKNLGIKGINISTDNNMNVDKGTLIILYNKYKDFILPLLVLLSSVLVLLFIVIPQIKQYLAIREQLDIENQKLEILKNNFNYLSNLDKTQAESDLKLLTKTLPVEKDYVGFMNALSLASSKVGLSIESYIFSVGNLTKAEGGTISQFPTIRMELKTVGNGILVSNFINELYRTVPLIQINKIIHDDNKAKISLELYFKPFPPQNVNDESPVTILSDADKNLIKQLYTWGNLNVQDGMIIPDSLISTESGLINSNPQTSATSSGFSPF